MSLFRITPERFEAVPRTSFAAESLLERKDLQRLLRRDLTPLGDDLIVIAEEYGEWEDSNRRIDLLCLSRDASLVVVEIKRTDDGGHMELQAVRYAAMVSSMTMTQVVEAYARTHGAELDFARSEVMSFLGSAVEEEHELSTEVRIILVSADFSTELTTTVLWLNQHDLDIRCIRLRPYRLGADILIDATQIIPLPEAADFEVKLRASEREKRKVVGERQEIFRKFWAQTIERSKARTQLLVGRSTTTDHWISVGIGRSGFSLSAGLTQTDGMVDVFMRLPGGEAKNLAILNTLRQKQAEIEQRFGGPLDWQELPGKLGCRICTHLEGGWRAPEAEWPAMQDRIIDAMIRMEHALKRPIQELVL